jgi:hypothetical protein
MDFAVEWTTLLLRDSEFSGSSLYPEVGCPDV